ncbi:MAG TPA: hypothetical protein VGI10_11900, partial [Polyangiaceae bacterium]
MRILGTGLIAVVLATCAMFLGCAPERSDVDALGTTRDHLTLVPPGVTHNSQYGNSIAADAQTLVISDPQATQPDPQGHPATRGAVYVYNRSGSDWQPPQTLNPDGPKSSEIHLGEGLLLSGNTLFASAPRDGLPGTDRQEGSVFVYTRSAPGQPFTFVTKVTAQAPLPEDRFGRYTATNGALLAVAGDLSGGFSKGIAVYSIQGSSFNFLYNVQVTKPNDIAMTPAGDLVALQTAFPPVVAFHLTQAGATPIDASAFPENIGYSHIKAGSSSVALLGGGQVAVAQVSASGLAAPSLIPLNLAANNSSQNIDYLEGQRILVSQNDSIRPGVLLLQPSGGTYATSGVIYPPIETRLDPSSQALGLALASGTDFLAVGAPGGLTGGRAYVLPLEPNGSLDGAVFETRELLPHDGCVSNCPPQFVFDVYGRLTAISGDLAVVSGDVLFRAGGGPSFHIYTRQASGTWQHTAKLDVGSKTVRSLVINSGRVFVGQGTFAGPMGFLDGSVRVYENVAGTWQQTGQMVAQDDGSQQSTFLGDAIAADGDTAVLGSFQAFYVFQRNADATWTQTAKVPVNIQATLASAHAVALTPNFLAVGAAFDSTVLENQGSVLVYRRSDFGLEQQIVPTATAVSGLKFGLTVAIDGTSLAIGGDFGGIELYDRTGSGATPWQLSSDLLPQQVFQSDYLVGSELALSGNMLLVGAPEDPLVSTGAAYLFERLNGKWDIAHAHILLPSDYASAGPALF